MYCYLENGVEQTIHAWWHPQADCRLRIVKAIMFFIVYVVWMLWKDQNEIIFKNKLIFEKHIDRDIESAFFYS